LKVTDISLADDPPTRWLDNPIPTLSVQKPQSDSIVAFCGMDEKSVGRPTGLGSAPSDDESKHIRIVIFELAAK
jgi:hypothetical protein